MLVLREEVGGRNAAREVLKDRGEEVDRCGYGVVRGKRGG